MNNNTKDIIYALIAGSFITMVVVLLFAAEYLPTFINNIFDGITMMLGGLGLGMTFMRDRRASMEHERELAQLAHEVDTQWESEYEEIDVPPRLRSKEQ